MIPPQVVTPAANWYRSLESQNVEQLGQRVSPEVVRGKEYLSSGAANRLRGRTRSSSRNPKWQD